MDRNRTSGSREREPGPPPFQSGKSLLQEPLFCVFVTDPSCGHLLPDTILEPPPPCVREANLKIETVPVKTKGPEFCQTLQCLGAVVLSNLDKARISPAANLQKHRSFTCTRISQISQNKSLYGCPIQFINKSSNTCRISVAGVNADKCSCFVHLGRHASNLVSYHGKK